MKRWQSLFQKTTPSIRLSQQFEKWNKNDQKLFEAVEKRDLGKISALLSKKAVRASKPNPKGQSAFHLAAAKGFTECLSTVLSHGVEINAKNDQGCTALHLSASGCHPECVKLLLQHGANEESIDFHSRTALHSAASSGCVSSVLLLCDQEDIALDARDDDGRTPLMIAAQRNHPTICSLLLERGALVNIIDKEKKTALILASEKGNVQAAETLLAHGADVTATDSLGHNALYCASLSRDEALRKVLQSALDKRKRGGSETDQQQLSRSQEFTDVHAEVKVPGLFRHSTSYDHLALQQDEWRRRYEEEQKKVSQLKEELLRKSHEHEVFAEGCRTEKDRLKTRIHDISDILQGKMNDVTGGRKELIRPLSQSYDQPHFLDLLAEQVQIMKGKNDEMEKRLQEETVNMGKKEKLAEELQQLEKKHQEEMERLQHQVTATVEEKAAAMKRISEIEGHLDNMRSVLSQFETRKRVHSNMMDDLNEHVFEMTCENERLRGLVKTLQENAEQEDKTGTHGTNLANKCKNAQNVLNSTGQELKQLLLQLRIDSANAQKEKQAILNKNKRKNLEDPAHILQQGLESVQHMERCEVSWKKTVSSLEHISSNLEKSKSVLLDPSTHQRPTYPLKNAGHQEVEETEVFVNGSTSAKQEGYTLRKDNSNTYLEQNHEAKIIERKRSSRNEEGMSPVHVQSSQVGPLQQEKHNVERYQTSADSQRHQNNILAIESVDMQEALSRVVELENEVSVLTLENAGLLKELNDVGEEKVKLQGELQALRHSLQTDFIPMQDVQGRVGELEQNFLLLTDELSTEQERTKKLMLQLESQRSEMHQLRDSFPPEIIQEEKGNDGKTFSTDILEELFWNVGTLVKKHNELRQQKSKLEQENEELSNEQTPYIPITLHNEKVTLLTQKIDQQTTVIADLEHKLSSARKAVEKLDEMTQKAEAQAKEIKQLEHKLSNAIGVLEDLTSMTHKIDSQATEIEGLELKLSSATKAVEDLTIMTHKMDEQDLEIQELKARLSNATKAVKDVTSWKRKIETQANEIRELERKLSIAMKAAEDLMAMTHKMNEQAVEVKELRNKLSAELANATKAAEDFTSMTNMMEAQASEIEELENKLLSSVKTAEDLASVTHKMEEQAIEIQELRNKLFIIMKAAEEVVSIANKIEAQNKKVQDIEQKLSKALTAVENLTSTAQRMDIQATEIEELRQKLSKATKAAEDFTSMTHKMETQTTEIRELEQTLSSAIKAVEDSTSMAHKIDLQAKEIKELQHRLFSATKDFESLQKELLIEKEKSVNKDEHLQIVSALEKHITDSKAELELEKVMLAGKCQEVKVLNEQLDQVSVEAERIKRREENCLQDHKKVKSSLELQIQSLKDELKDMSEKLDHAFGPDAHNERKDATKTGADQDKPSKMTILQDEPAVHCMKSEASQDPTTYLLEKVSQLSCMCEDKEKKIAEVLGDLKMFSEEMVHLQSTHDQLQQQLKETQKQHQKTISIYRTHLLYAAQGFMDEEVHMSLLRIRKMQESMVC